jgi:hypothetical protein
MFRKNRKAERRKEVPEIMVKVQLPPNFVN